MPNFIIIQKTLHLYEKIKRDFKIRLQQTVLFMIFNYKNIYCIYLGIYSISFKLNLEFKTTCMNL